MRVKYYYCLEDKWGLVKFLSNHQIPFKKQEIPEIKYTTYTFSLYEDQDEYKKFALHFPFLKYNSIKDIEFTKEEIHNAEWLILRSKSLKVEWEYTEKAFQQLCPYKKPFVNKTYYKHYQQISELSVNKPIKWKAGQFFSGPNSNDDIIFCSEKAKKILDNRWSGLEFWKVKKISTSKHISDLYQLFFATTLPIDALEGGKIVFCNNCGKKIMRITEGTNQLTIKKTYLKCPNEVYRIDNILTGEHIGYSTFSVNIVSQKFYQFCEKNRMNRGLTYEPLKII